VPCFFIFIRSLAVPEKLDCRRVTDRLSWCLQLRLRSRDAFLNTPSSLPPNLAALLLKVEASLMSAVCQPKPHSSVGAREAGSLFVEMLYLGDIYKVPLQETCISIFLSI